MPGLITKRGKKRYRGQVMVNGILSQKLFPDSSKKSYKAALAWEIEERQRLETELTETNTVSLTVESWANEYLDDVKDRFAKKTYDEKRSAFVLLAKESKVQPDMPVENITVTICRGFLKKQFKNRSGYAANKDRKNLSAAWEWGRTNLEGWPKAQNPFQAIQKFPEKRSPRYVPSEEDFWKVFDLAEGQDQLMLLSFLHLGGRRGEIFRMTWQDVDFINSRIRLWTRKREGGVYEYDWLPMTTELRQVLMQWWEKRPVKEAPHVFICLNELPCCEEHYGKPFKTRQHFMNQICKKAGVKSFGFHAIRHLTASILYRKGYSVSVIQAILRHKNPNTTTRYLRSLGLEQVREALEEGLIKGTAEVIPLQNKKPLRS